MYNSIVLLVLVLFVEIFVLFLYLLSIFAAEKLPLSTAVNAIKMLNLCKSIYNLYLRLRFGSNPC